MCIRDRTSLAVLPVLNQQASIGSLLRLWGVVYVSNLIGGTVFAGLIVIAGPGLGSIDREIFAEIAHKMTDHPGWLIILSGLLAGWLMGLLSWLVAAGRDTTSQIIIVWLITTAIGVGHLHHCILGSVEVLAGVFTAPDVTVADYFHFLVWATLGNIIGGLVFLGILKFAQARSHQSRRIVIEAEDGA